MGVAGLKIGREARGRFANHDELLKHGALTQFVAHKIVVPDVGHKTANGVGGVHHVRQIQLLRPHTAPRR
jgi:hypothetical protein